MDKTVPSENQSVSLMFIAGKIVGMKPGYFRLLSDFRILVTHKGQIHEEDGTTLHEIVAFKTIEQVRR